MSAKWYRSLRSKAEKIVFKLDPFPSNTMVAKASSNVEGRLNDVELVKVNIKKHTSTLTRAIEHFTQQFSTFIATSQVIPRASSRKDPMYLKFMIKKDGTRNYMTFIYLVLW